MWLITLNGGDVRRFRSLHQLLTLSLWRCRSRRACACACVHPHAHVCDVYAYICAGVHVCVYMHMRVRPCTHTCASVCMRMHVPTYAQMGGPGSGASVCQAVSWARVRTHVHVHACARVYDKSNIKHGRVCARPAVRGVRWGVCVRLYTCVHTHKLLGYLM